MEKNWKFSRWGVLLVFVSFSFCLCSSLNDEGLALLRLKERVASDPFGALLNWKSSDTENTPCSWFGVECSEGKVIILNLKDLCLVGTLAPELKSLTHIKAIILRNNSFSGIIPEGFGELKELEVLDLGYNEFSGPVPSDLGINRSLTILLLDNNELLGSISPEIHELQIISESQVDEQQLSNAAKEGHSWNTRFITWNGVHNEDASHRRLLQVVPPDFGGVNPNTPSPAQSPSGPIPTAAATPSNGPEGSPKSPAPAAAPDLVPSLSPPPSSAPLPNNSPPTSPQKSGGSSSSNVAILGVSVGGGAIFLLILIIGGYLCRSNKVKTIFKGICGANQPNENSRAVAGKRRLSEGVPNLKKSELDSACEDFSNVIGSSPIGMVYKGTLSSGVEIAVASVAVASAKDWSKNLEVQFRKKIDTLSKMNHKNFVNLIGYCEEEEPFTRMLVFEYAPNGTLFEHLHVRESEHLDWGMRLRIAMGMAYCLEYMHQLNPPISHNHLNSSAVHLTEDYAAKLSDLSFWNERAAGEMETACKELLDTPSVGPKSNVYSLGVLLFEMLTGRLPYMVGNGSLEDWASDYLRMEQPLKEMVDPTLRSFDVKQLEKLGEVMKSCVHPDPKQRPPMRDVTERLREITGITRDEAIPKLSPLWWAELEILSTEAV